MLAPAFFGHFFFNAGAPSQNYIEMLLTFGFMFLPYREGHWDSIFLTETRSHKVFIG